MERAVVQVTLFGLLLVLASTLPNKDDWNIYSFHINSTVTSRYATTIITSRVANRMDDSKEIQFEVRIPKNAFISKFRMFIDGQVYDGVVKGKEKAQQQYTEAVSRGQSAGLVSSVGRTLEEFKTSVTVAAHKKVTFELTYEELLKRRLGKYELQIHARPMQPVKDFKIDVYINEKAGINFIEVKGGLSTKALANAITRTHTDKQAWVYFYPTEDQQKTCDACGVQGMNGDLIVSYDVNRDTSLGDIKTSAGYFVHHFAPSSLSRIPKNVVFVIDQSGSMSGRKIEQTRIALIHILNDLAEEDHFGLITFDSSVFHWKRELVQANKKNLESAKTFAQNIRERGATDINAAVLEGSRMLNAHPREGSASIVILLTDGDPTSGYKKTHMHTNVRRDRRVTFSDTNATVEYTGTDFDSHIQRVWAYLTVKQLLEKELLLSGAEKEKVKKEALELSLKYSFVTPLTSMVVTKPLGENTDVLHKPKEGETTQALPPLVGQIQYISSFFLLTIRRLSQAVGSGLSGVPLSHRFLLKTENLSLPLCFDVTGDVRLKLLHHPNRELSVNGELDTVTNGGFRRIVIHLKTDLDVEVVTNVITVREGQTTTRHTGQDFITAGSLTVIRWDKEIDVAVGDTRMVIYIHEKDGVEFLWPVLRQRPLDNNVTGILALKPAVYEEVQQTPSTKLQIKDREIDVVRANAVDYSFVSSLTLDCWLMSAESVLQRRLDDFIVTQL
ncbi:inter-alpha-trypsin inhibitor heavy chain H3-like [Etheostoma cragini]|uniref:inter-alpha-trypsin inhibitor heavy chain H3-like n=1 Tax=Etheostoma cragini TaxID=417921 RepID=UPI00155E3101|nr:inter-alpha-trypsin inhibitor heavy chain H3-like [Etheostoma cragini]